MVKSRTVELLFDTMPKATLRAFKYLSGQKWLDNSGWYLAGGTALALQVGYRQSVDLDFFIHQGTIKTAQLFEKVANKNWQTRQSDEGTVFAKLFDASISFIAYPFFIRKLPFIKYGSISILDAQDIAVMKIVALSQRGKKRDFFDLYYCAHNVLPLEEIMIRLKKQYPSVAHNYHHILKSLIYFTDAEGDPEPNLLIDLDWKTVKAYFETEIPRLTKKLLRI